jgi:hypothetical protein
MLATVRTSVKRLERRRRPFKAECPPPAAVARLWQVWFNCFQ